MQLLSLTADFSFFCRLPCQSSSCHWLTCSLCNLQTLISRSTFPGLSGEFPPTFYLSWQASEFHRHHSAFHFGSHHFIYHPIPANRIHTIPQKQSFCPLFPSYYRFRLCSANLSSARPPNFHTLNFQLSALSGECYHAKPQQGFNNDIDDQLNKPHASLSSVQLSVLGHETESFNSGPNPILEEMPLADSPPP